MSKNIILSEPNRRKCRKKSPYEDVSTFHCPGCDGYRFNIFRDNLFSHDSNGKEVPPKEIAGCLDCHAFTYVYKLKNRYRKNLDKDFEVCEKRIGTITNSCQQCGLEFTTDNRIYEETMYYDTDYYNMKPPLPHWCSARHP